MKKKWLVREEREGDFPEIDTLVRTIFQSTLISDGNERDFFSTIRSGDRFVPELSLVVEEKSQVIGYLMLSELPRSKTRNGEKSLLLSPVCTREEYRHQGVASSLIHAALEKAKKRQYEAIFLIGHPIFYSRFGFMTAKAAGIREINGAPQEYVQALALTPGGLQNISEVDLLA